VSSPIRFEDLELDVSGYQLRRAGEAIKLERIPMELLMCLAANPGRLMLRSELAARIWGEDHHLEDDCAINTAVRKLRTALSDNAEKPRFIETVTGKGYRFVAAIRKQSRPGEAGQPGPAPSIAVLPFENLSPDSENEYFAEGLAEEILNALTKVPGLRVVARTSAFAFRGRGSTIREVGDKLKVGTVLEGSVRKVGTRIRVTAQLIHVEDESHLWSERYDRNLTDIFDLQDELSQAIVDALRMKLTRPAHGLPGDRYAGSVEAYNLYLKGRFHIYRFTSDEIALGLQYMNQAIALDPDCAPAQVELAHHELMLAFMGVTAPPAFLPRCRAALTRMVARFDACAEAHTVLGLLRGVCDYRWEEAGRELRRARELSPAYPLAQSLTGNILAGQGRLREAIPFARRAVDLDPLSPLFNHGLSILLTFSREFAGAVEHSRVVLESQPDCWFACGSLGGAYAAAGRLEEAIGWLEKGRRLAPAENWITGWLASAYARAGRTGDAERILSEVTALRQGTYVSAAALATICAALEDAEGAFAWLEKAVSESDPMLFFLTVDPVFEGLRSHAHFAKLLRTMNLLPLLNLA